MQYYFNDHLRWNLGFATPNQGGAWVATLLPWLWGLPHIIISPEGVGTPLAGADIDIISVLKNVT